MSDLKANLATHIKLEDGQVEVGPAAFWENAPEGITEEVVNKVRTYESDYICASSQVMAEAGQAYLADNPDTDLMVGSFSMGAGVDVTHSFHKNADDGEWSAVASVDRELTGADVLSKLQDDACQLLGGK